MQKKLIVLAVLLFVNAAVCRPSGESSSSEGESKERTVGNAWDPKNPIIGQWNLDSQGRAYNAHFDNRHASNEDRSDSLTDMANTIQRLPSNAQNGNIIYVNRNGNINNGEKQLEAALVAEQQLQQQRARSGYAAYNGYSNQQLFGSRHSNEQVWRNAYPVAFGGHSNQLSGPQRSGPWVLNHANQFAEHQNIRYRNGKNNSQEDEESQERRHREKEVRRQQEADRKEASEELKAMREHH